MDGVGMKGDGYCFWENKSFGKRLRYLYLISKPPAAIVIRCVLPRGTGLTISIITQTSSTESIARNYDDISIAASLHLLACAMYSYQASLR